MTANYDLPGVVEKRVRFFDGQFLQDQDFVDEQNYHLDRERRPLRLLHVAGIAEGLAVAASAAQPNTVTVAPGTAIDSDGRQLALAQAATVDLPAARLNDKQGIEVYISYGESAEDQQTEAGSSDFTRWLERPQFTAIAPDEAAYAGEYPPVLLARLALDSAGRVTVDDTVRSYSGLRLPGPGAGAPALRSTATGQADLDSALTIDGDLTFAAAPATISGAGRLHITGEELLYLLNKSGVVIGKEWGGTGSLTVEGDLQANGAASVHQNLAVAGRIGIGTTAPQTTLHVSGGKGQFDGQQQIIFTDTDTTNNLKLQLWSKYGLGINPSTLFYAADGTHSWRDAGGINERMALTTAAGGGLTVKGTGASTFAGTVGIGTTTPKSDLQIGDFGQQQNRYLTFKVDGSNKYSSGLRLWTWTENYGYSIEYDERVATGNGLHIRTHNEAVAGQKNVFAASDGTSRVFVGWNGYVGIGTTNPSALLTVNGDLTFAATSASTIRGAGRLHIAGEELLYLLNKGGVIVGQEWGGNGNLRVEGTFSQASDARLKTRIRRLESALDKLAGIRGVSYLQRNAAGADDASGGKPAIGVIAQEVEAVFPELVSTIEGNPYKGVHYGGLTAVLLEAVKELKAALDPLLERVGALEAHA